MLYLVRTCVSLFIKSNSAPSEQAGKGGARGRGRAMEEQRRKEHEPFEDTRAEADDQDEGVLVCRAPPEKLVIEPDHGCDFISGLWGVHLKAAPPSLSLSRHGDRENLIPTGQCKDGN